MAWRENRFASQNRIVSHRIDRIVSVLCCCAVLYCTLPQRTTIPQINLSPTTSTYRVGEVVWMITIYVGNESWSRSDTDRRYYLLALGKYVVFDICCGRHRDRQLTLGYPMIYVCVGMIGYGFVFDICCVYISINVKVGR